MCKNSSRNFLNNLDRSTGERILIFVNSQCLTESLHQCLDLIYDGVGPDLITLCRWMQSIRHDLGSEPPIRSKELAPNVHVEDFVVIGECFEFRINFFDRCAQWICWVCIAWKNAQNQNFCLRLAFLEFIDDQAITVHDFINGITVDIVRSQHQNNELCVEPVEFTVLHPPK